MTTAKFFFAALLLVVPLGCGTESTSPARTSGTDPTAQNKTTGSNVSRQPSFDDDPESGEKFEIQIAGELIYVPVRAGYNIEHEREGDSEEIEFQVKWTHED